MSKDSAKKTKKTYRRRIAPNHSDDEVTVMKELGERLKSLLECAEPIPYIHVPSRTPETFQYEQKVACKNAERVRLSVLVGDFGTGKTKTCQWILENIVAQRILLVSITPLDVKNSRRGMRENVMNLTLNSLIECSRKNKTDRVVKSLKNVHVLYVEEASQISALQLLKMLRALPNLRRIIISGDLSQNAPIGGEPSILQILFDHFGEGHVITTLRAPLFYHANNCSLLLKGRWQYVEYISFGDESKAFKSSLVMIQRKPTISESVARLINLSKNAKDGFENITIVTYGDGVSDEFNRHMSIAFNGDYDEASYDPNDIFVGEKILIGESYSGSENYVFPKGATSLVTKGSIYRIKEIVDINIFQCEMPVRSTKTPSSYTDGPHYSRVIRFDDDSATQINLSQYGIKNLTRGYALAIHKLQMSKVDNVLYYISEADQQYDRRMQYVACSHARRSVVIECAFDKDAINLSGSDVARICDIVPNERRSLDASLMHYLPAFKRDEMYARQRIIELQKAIGNVAQEDCLANDPSDASEFSRSLDFMEITAPQTPDAAVSNGKRHLDCEKPAKRAKKRPPKPNGKTAIGQFLCGKKFLERISNSDNLKLTIDEISEEDRIRITDLHERGLPLVHLWRMIIMDTEGTLAERIYCFCAIDHFIGTNASSRIKPTRSEIEICAIMSFQFLNHKTLEQHCKNQDLVDLVDLIKARKGPFCVGGIKFMTYEWENPFAKESTVESQSMLIYAYRLIANVSMENKNRNAEHFNWFDWYSKEIGE